MSIFLSYIPTGITFPDITTQQIIFQNLLKLKTEILPKKLCCERSIDIEEFIPDWILEQKSKNPNAITIFDFIQKYYDWLYCSNTEQGGSGYLLDIDLEKITDIENITDSYSSRLNSVYFPYFDENSYILRKDGGVLGKRLVSQFIRSIKTKFLIKKGSPESCDLFFTKLFGVTGFAVDYSREKIIKLNGGFFCGPNGFSANPESGLLNRKRLQNGIEFTDYSYSIKVTGITATPNLIEFYENMLHPIGTNFYFNFNLDTVTADPGPTTTIEQSITPELKFYSAYQILDTNYIGVSYEINIGGITYYGLSGNPGCSFNAPFKAPTHVFPSWSIGMTGQTGFQNMEIRDMFKIQYSQGTTNPNINNTECN
jgi:hypothetical protein